VAACLGLVACGGSLAPSDGGRDAPSDDHPGDSGSGDGDGDAPDAGDRPGDAGGGDADAPIVMTGDWTSGSRLRARLVRAVETGDAIFDGVFDRELGIDCVFTDVGAGVTRCMPLTPVRHFSDAACQNPVVPFATDAPPPSYFAALRVAGTACRPVVAAYKVGARLTIQGRVYFRANDEPDGACMVTQGGTYIYALDPVPLTSFVAASEVREPRGGGLEARLWRSEDSGAFPIGIWNPSRAESCIAGTGGYADRCVPEMQAFFPPFGADVFYPGGGSTFAGNPTASADVACTQRLAQRTNACDAPTAVNFALPDGCGGRPTNRVAEANPHTSSYYYVAVEDGLCRVGPPDDQHPRYTAGADIPASSLPPLTTTVEGAGRLKRYVYTTASGERVNAVPRAYDDSLYRVPIFHDSAIDEPCALRETKTLGRRCFPVRSSMTSYFLDDTYSTPIYVRSKTAAASCSSPPPTAIYMLWSSLEDYDVFKLAAMITPATVYYRLVHRADDASAFDVWSLTPATEADFAELDLGVE
jgi:hypothetical protein